MLLPPLLPPPLLLLLLPLLLLPLPSLPLLAQLVGLQMDHSLNLTGTIGHNNNRPQQQSATTSPRGPMCGLGAPRARPWSRLCRILPRALLEPTGPTTPGG